MASQSPTSRKPFADAAVAAFPRRLRAAARATALRLAASVDDSYRTGSSRVDVSGEGVYIPDRLLFLAGAEVVQNLDRASPLAQCLLSRSTDGYLRQRALRSILALQEAWIIPFVALPIGEYVVEIVDDIRSSLPSLNRDAYANFVRENRPTMRLLRAQAISYWDRYYRDSYPEKKDYPAITVLNQLDQWAS